MRTDDFKFCVYADEVSPHQMPLFRALIEVYGSENSCYIYKDYFIPNGIDRKGMGWEAENEDWLMPITDERAGTILETVDVLLCRVRDCKLMESRASKGLLTFYTSERWFNFDLGIFRLLYPPYLIMAMRIVRMLLRGSLLYLPAGVGAARDMARLVGLFKGDIRCVLRPPTLSFASRPGGEIFQEGKRVDYMRMWGYFVKANSGTECRPQSDKGRLSVLWIGRLVDWKCTETAIRAISQFNRLMRDSEGEIVLDVYGDGPERSRLSKLIKRLRVENSVTLAGFVPVSKVRELMRNHDVLLMTSNEYEGWGAVVNEALEEGCYVIGTYEAGASATILPEGQLYHAYDFNSLGILLSRLREQKLSGNPLNGCRIGEWAVSIAAKYFTGMVRQFLLKADAENEGGK